MLQPGDSSPSLMIHTSPFLNILLSLHPDPLIRMLARTPVRDFVTSDCRGKQAQTLETRCTRDGRWSVGREGGYGKRKECIDEGEG